MTKFKKEGPPAGDKPAAAPATDKAAATAAPADKAAAAPADTGDDAKDSGEAPLIDEDIFDGEIDNNEIEVSNLFETSEEDAAAAVTADDIPDGVDV